MQLMGPTSLATKVSEGCDHVPHSSVLQHEPAHRSIASSCWSHVQSAGQHLVFRASERKTMWGLVLTSPSPATALCQTVAWECI